MPDANPQKSLIQDAARQSNRAAWNAVGMAVAAFGLLLAAGSVLLALTILNEEDSAIDPDPVLQLIAHQGAGRALAFNDEGSQVATGGADNAIRIWDAESGDLILEFDDHSAAVVALGWAGDIITSQDASGQILTWDATNGNPLDTSEEIPPDPPQTRWIAEDWIADSTATGLIFYTGQAEAERTTLTTAQVLALAVRPNHNELAAVDAQGRLSFWKIPDIQ